MQLAGSDIPVLLMEEFFSEFLWLHQALFQVFLFRLILRAAWNFQLLRMHNQKKFTLHSDHPE